MNVLELIEKCDIEKTTVQLLQTDTLKVVDKPSTKDSEITFATKEYNANDHFNTTGKVGLVVWLDGDVARKLLTKE